MVQTSDVSESRAAGVRTSYRLRRRDEIIKAATNLFCERGYHDVTMDEIAEEMGVSKGTIYNYFSSKEKTLPGNS